MSAVIQLSCHLQEKLLLEEHNFSNSNIPLSQIQDPFSKTGPLSTCSTGPPLWDNNVTYTPVSSAEQIMSTIAFAPVTYSNITANSAQYSNSSVSSKPVFKIPNQPPKLSKNAAKSELLSMTKKNSKSDINFSTMNDLQNSCFLKQGIELSALSKVGDDQPSSINVSSDLGHDTQAFSTCSGKSEASAYSINSTENTFPACTDFPPNKKHCRSVSDSDAVAQFHPFNFLSSPSLSWTPGVSSQVWVPSKSFSSSSLISGNKLSDSSSKSENLQSKSFSGCAQNFLFTGTPPLFSTPPHPTSVIVLPPLTQPHNEFATLSPRLPIADHDQDVNVQSFLSPSPQFVSPSPSQGAATPVHSRTSLAATKRALSFSEDFGYRESVEYKPFSTPESKRRSNQGNVSGGLLRCQSHPADLNVKRGKSRRRAKFGYNRPSLDFMKMKQSSFSKLSRHKERNASVSKIFKPIPLLSASQSFQSTIKDADNFMCVSRSFSPDGSDTFEQVESMASAAGEDFQRECHDLDVNEIENEDDQMA